MQRSQTPTTQRPHRTSAPPRRTEGNVTKNGTWEVPCTAFKRSSGTAVARDLQGRFLGLDAWLPASGVGRLGTTAEGAPVTHYALGTPGAGRGGATRTALTRIITASLLSSTGTSAPTWPGTAAAAQQCLKLQFRGGTSRTRARCRRKYRLHAEAAVWLALFRTWAGRKRLGCGTLLGPRSLPVLSFRLRLGALSRTLGSARDRIT